MLFNSTSFLLFLPIVLVIYYLLPRRIRQIWLLAASYYFYMNWNAVYGLLLLGITFLSYLGARLMTRYEQKPGLRKIIFSGTLVLDIGSLVFFKYTGFLINCINKLLSFTPPQFSLHWDYDILLPVGISFYVLQSVGYLIDVYRGSEKEERNFLKYALFLSFFPQLVAGPIERTGNLMHQLDKPQKLTWENCKRGMYLILWGYFMKLVIADRVAILVDTVYEHPDTYPGVYIIVATIFFAIQIYCDFNGYSTIARGVALLFGIRLMDNFNAPYLAQSVSDFWRRWHISLTGWFRDYLYIPLGGNRKGELRKQFNRFVVFGISGLWHGASIAFLVWGLLNALFQTMGDCKKKISEKISLHFPSYNPYATSFSIRLAKRVITFGLVCITWVFFRAGGFLNAMTVFRYACTANWIVLFTGHLYELGITKEIFQVTLLAIAALFTVDYYKYTRKDVVALLEKQTWWFQCATMLLLTFTILLFGCYGKEYDAAQFIYFQF